MKKTLFTILACSLFLNAPLFAQEHSAVVARVKLELQAQGADLSGPCGAFKITKSVAWELRAEDAGTLDKPMGNNCEGRAVDIIVYPDGHGFDILTDGGGNNGPSWSPVPIDNGAARWRPVVADPSTGIGGAPTTPIVVDTPPTLIAQADINALVDLLAEHDKATREKLDAIAAQNERIYADLANRLDARPTMAAPVTVPGVLPLPLIAKDGNPTASVLMFIAKYGGSLLSGYLAAQAAK